MWRRAIKFSVDQFSKVLITVVTGVMLLVTVLLVDEYLFFRQQSEELVELKEDYRNYVVAVKKVLHDYNKEKERLDEFEVASVKEKKKGVKVFSSDDEETEDSFIVLNRDLDYLRQSSIDYIKEQDVEFLLKRVNFDQWRDYNEQVITAAQPKKASQKQKRTKTKKALHAKNKPPKHMTEDVRPAQAPDMLFAWPIDRSLFYLSSRFGPRKIRGEWKFHYAIDMAANRGTPVKAAASGVIVEAGIARGYGKTIVIAHNQKYRTRYAHLNTIFVKMGQKVDRGERIGAVGATGNVRSKKGHTGDHLHFEVSAYGKKINPLHCLV